MNRKYLEKMERISKISENIEMSSAFREELKAQTERLRETRTKFTGDTISPFKL
jgi:phosphoenolpyruvate carboxykinase (GTP)